MMMLIDHSDSFDRRDEALMLLLSSNVFIEPLQAGPLQAGLLQAGLLQAGLECGRPAGLALME